jgi:hypothetical protein
MLYEEYYTHIKYEKNILNENEVINTAKNCLVNQLSVNEKLLLIKIENSINRGEIIGLDVKSILTEIVTQNKFAISKYKKDPTRQNISELCQINYIQKYKKFEFNKHGENLRFTKDGTKLVNKKIPGAVSKSFDFTFKLKNDEIAFGMGKTTFSVGGHQDNVEEETISFLERMNSYNRFNDKPKKFFILVDGDFWNDNIMSKLKRFETNNVKIFTSNNITNEW